MSRHSPRAVIFDLDGTLLDTLEDIATSANQVLTTLGFPVHTIDAYRSFIGEGVGTLFARAMPKGVAAANPHLVERAIIGFADAYHLMWNVATRPYPGIPELLNALAARSIRMAVLSNKPDSFVRQCVDVQLSDWPFLYVQGDREDIPRKPDPAGALRAASILRAFPEEILYLGDTPVDMATATRAGMVAVGAGWGFRPAAELTASGAVRVLHDPRELLEFLP